MKACKAEINFITLFTCNSLFICNWQIDITSQKDLDEKEKGKYIYNYMYGTSSMIHDTFHNNVMKHIFQSKLGVIETWLAFWYIKTVSSGNKIYKTIFCLQENENIIKNHYYYKNGSYKFTLYMLSQHTHIRNESAAELLNIIHSTRPWGFTCCDAIVKQKYDVWMQNASINKIRIQEKILV